MPNAAQVVTNELEYSLPGKSQQDLAGYQSSFRPSFTRMFCEINTFLSAVTMRRNRRLKDRQHYSNAVIFPVPHLPLGI